MQLNKLLTSLWCLLCKEKVVSRHNCTVHLNANTTMFAANEQLAHPVSTGVATASPDGPADAEPSSCYSGQH